MVSLTLASAFCGITYIQVYTTVFCFVSGRNSDVFKALLLIVFHFPAVHIINLLQLWLLQDVCFIFPDVACFVLDLNLIRSLLLGFSNPFSKGHYRMGYWEEFE